MERAFVTGAGGYIGSTLCDALLLAGHEVVGYDNFSTGRETFIQGAIKSKRYRLVRENVLNLEALTSAMAGCDTVFHLQANADVRFGVDHPGKDLQQNTIGTFNVLEAMRANAIKKIIFSSTGSVYGEAQVIPTPEDAPFPIQTSLYGASKVACEGLISSYCAGFGLEACVFRYVSILGPRYTHGHIFDFYKQLQTQPAHLHILGNGKQRKSYLHVNDCINAILLCANRVSWNGYQIFNLGTEEYCEIMDSIGWICDELKVYPTFSYSSDKNSGWVGDNSFIYLDTKKIRNLGWSSHYSIEDGVRLTLRWLRANEWVFTHQSVGGQS